MAIPHANLGKGRVGARPRDGYGGRRPRLFGQSVRAFGTFTKDLHDLADWFQSCDVTTVAMESTGVYRIAAYEILEQHGFEVVLVNARYAKNVPGRKTDVSDASWLRQLHSYGLLRGSFRDREPFDVVEHVRSGVTPASSKPWPIRSFSDEKKLSMPALSPQALDPNRPSTEPAAGDLIGISIPR